MQDDREEPVQDDAADEGRGSETGGIASSPAKEDAGEEGLGTETSGEGGPDDPEHQHGGLGGDPAGGPTKDTTSPPGGGSVDGPEPGGVPKEGHVDPHPDTSSGSSESQ
jgi:hypothetical protein